MNSHRLHSLSVAILLTAFSTIAFSDGFELASGVTGYGGQYAQPAVYVSGDIAIVSGLVKLGSTAQIGTLPANARPKSRLVFTVWSGTSHARVDVTPDGKITVVGSRSSWVSLNGITFPTR
jgi:hypothetical protein